MGWRLAPSLAAARNEANAIAPKRSRVSDGTIGDPAHQSRTSDHNVGARDLVHALDLTYDPQHFDVHAYLERIRKAQDKRVKYLISRSRICGPGTKAGGWEWRPYTGSNPHDKHGHISIHSTVAAETDTRPWWPAPTPNPEVIALKVPNYFKTLVAPNGGWWHAAGDGGIFAADNGAGSPIAPFKGSIPGSGGLPTGSVVMDFVPHGEGYAFVVRHAGGDFTGYHYP